MTWLYMPSMCAPDTADSHSDCASPGSTYEPWLTLSGKPTRRPLSSPAWRTRPWIARLSGMTSTPFQQTTFTASWTSSLAESHANRSPAPASNAASTTNDGCGLRSGQLFSDVELAGCSSRTSPSSDGMGSLPSWLISAHAGGMRNGCCFRRQRLAPRIVVTGSGSWPTATATATDAKASGGNPQTSGSHGTTLTDAAVRMWGTPVARDDNKTPEAHMAMKARMNRNTPTSLQVQSKMWATPKASEMDRGSDPDRGPKGGSPGLRRQVTEQDGQPGLTQADLNPRFVEALMGLPDGWSDPSASLTGFTSWVTVSSQHVQRLLSVSSPEGC